VWRRRANKRANDAAILSPEQVLGMGVTVANHKPDNPGLPPPPDTIVQGRMETEGDVALMGYEGGGGKSGYEQSLGLNYGPNVTVRPFGGVAIKGGRGGGNGSGGGRGSGDGMTQVGNSGGTYTVPPSLAMPMPHV